MLTASIVIYNTKPELVETVIESYEPKANKVLFILDNSQVETEIYKNRENITYIFNGKNLGYGTAHNIAIDKAIEMKADYHIVLNPDLQFEPCIVDELKKYADMHGDVVYILPKVIYPDGSLQYLCKLLPTPIDLIFRRFFPDWGPFKKANDRYILKKCGYDRIINPPCLSGCFMFMRVDALKDNKFDNHFFMYCEDFDLIRRLHRVGKTLFYPYVTIIHNHEHGSYKNRKMLIMHINSACRYFNKYGWFFDRERKKQNDSIIKEIEGNNNCI